MTAKQTPISIRPAREDDCSRVAEIGARAWKAIYDGLQSAARPGAVRYVLSGGDPAQML